MEVCYHCSHKETDTTKIDTPEVVDEAEEDGAGALGTRLKVRAAVGLGFGPAVGLEVGAGVGFRVDRGVGAGVGSGVGRFNVQLPYTVQTRLLSTGKLQL